MFSVSKAEHASSMGPTLKLHVMEEEGRGQTGLWNFHRYWLVYNK